MTNKLYYDDAYIKEFSSVVLSVTKCEALYDVVLTETAFFPEEGGQYSDKGTINGISVVDVKEDNGVIHHYLTESVEEGSSVIGAIDFEERYEKMQCHSAEHILSGIIHRLFKLDNVGFHLGAEDVTMDISAPLTREELDRVEILANEVVYKNIPITTCFPSESELGSLEYRSKLALTENVRIVNIGEYDSCACCAPHVKYTGEIGLIKILDFSKLRGGIRIRITAGRRAMKIFREYYDSIQSISSMLSVPKSDVTEGAKKLLSDYSSLKTAYSAERIANITRMAEEFSDVDGNSVKLFSDATVEEMIAFSNIAVSRVSGILVLLSGTDGEYKYVMSSKNVDLKERAQDINKSLLGRGGGKSNMIQGSLSASLDAVKEYFSGS